MSTGYDSGLRGWQGDPIIEPAPQTIPAENPSLQGWQGDPIVQGYEAVEPIQRPDYARDFAEKSFGDEYIEGFRDLADQITSSDYSIFNNAGSLQDLTPQDRTVLQYAVEQSAERRRKANENRSSIGGITDSFLSAAGGAISAANQGIGGFSPIYNGDVESSRPIDPEFMVTQELPSAPYTDEEYDFNRRVSAVDTTPKNQGNLQWAAEQTASLIPDVIGTATATAATGPSGAFLYWFNRSKEGAKETLLDNNVDRDTAEAASALMAGPMAAVEMLQFGNIPGFKSVKQKMLQGLLSEGVKKITPELVKKAGGTTAGRLAGKAANVYTVQMAEETAQSIVELSGTTIAKAIDEGGYNQETHDMMLSEFHGHLQGLKSASVAIPGLLAGSRAVGSITKIPKGLKYFADKTDDQLIKMFDVDAETIKKAIGKEGIPSRSELKSIIGSKQTNARERAIIQDELRMINEANKIPESSEESLPVQGPPQPLGPRRPQVTEDNAMSFDFDSFDDGSGFETESDTFNPEEFDTNTAEEPAAGYTGVAELDAMYFSDLEKKFKSQNSKALDVSMEIRGVEIDKETFGNKKTNAAKVHAIVEYEKNVRKIAGDYNVDTQFVKELVDDSWAAQQSADKNRPIIEQIQSYIEIPKFKEKGKWVEKPDSAIFGVGADLYNLKGRSGITRGRKLISRLQKIVGAEVTQKKNPTLEEVKIQAFSLLDQMSADQWKGVDEAGDGVERNNLGSILSGQIPGEWMKEQVLQYIHDKTFPPVKGSYEFMDAAVARYADNESLYNNGEYIESFNESDAETVRGTLGGIGRFKDYMPKRKMQATQIEVDRVRVLGSEVATRMDNNNGLQPEGAIAYIWGSMKDGLDQLLKKREHLDMTKEHGMVVRSMLRTLEGMIRAATQDTMHEISAILRELHGPEKKVFQELLIFEDMKANYEIVQNESAFRNGIKSIEELNQKLLGMRDIANKNPVIADALKKRERIITPIVKELVEMELIPPESLDNPMEYFHRQVMVHQHASIQQKEYEKKTKRLPSSSSDVSRTLEEQKLGYQTQRKSNKDMRAREYDYNANYIQSEFEWLSQAKQQLLQVKFMEKIEEKYDFTKKLEQQAKYENTVKWFGGQNKYKAIMDARNRAAELDAMLEGGQMDKSEYKVLRPPLTAFIGKNDPSVSFRQKMATAVSKTNKLLDKAGIHNDIHDYNQFFNEALEDRSEIFQGNPTPPEIKMYAASYLKAMNEQRVAMAEAIGGKDGQNGVKFVTPEKIVDRDDKYGFFLSLPGNRFYTVATITEAAAEKLEEAALANMKVKASDIKVREQYAVGKNKPLILPVDIANEFNSMDKLDKPRGFLATAIKAATTEFKKIALLSPGRILGYVIRNKIGDTEAMFMGTFGDGASKHVSKAWHIAKNLRKYRNDIADARASGKKLSPELKKLEKLIDQLIQLDIVGSSAATRELSRAPELKRFDETKPKNTLDAGWQTFTKMYHGYFEKAGHFAEVSENWTRIVGFLNYQEKLSKGEKFSYGGSDRKYIDTIRKEFGDDVAAGQLARDLLGDYGETSIAVEKMSQTFVPFAKFQGINVERMLRIVKNNAIDTKNGIKGGQVFSPAMIAARIALPYASLMMYNYLFFGDEEEQLAAYDRANPHLILGRRSDGSLMVMRNFSVSGDFLEWFGLNSIRPLVGQYLDGKIEIDDIAWEMVKDPVNKIAGSLTPLIKSPAEAVAGQSYFPDVTNPRPVDKDVAIASSVMSAESYRWLKGQTVNPGERPRPGHYSIPNMFGLSISNPKDNALNDTYGLITSYKNSKGIPVPNYPSSATVHMKRAAQFQDYQSFLKAKEKFLADGGDANKFLRSIRNYDPVDRMTKEQEEEFLNEYINKYDQEKVHVARDYVKRIQGTLWNWWEKSEGGISTTFSDRVTSKLTSFGSNHSRDSQTDWNAEHKETVEWMKDRNITLNQAVGYLRDYYTEKKTKPKTKFANLRRARQILLKNGLK